jgi:predicted  nucleic acid-binding Zn-ribbon protein
MFEAWSISKSVLAAAKWPCIQTTVGANGAALCTALSVETEATETEYELESFCLGAQRDATMTAVAQTQQNVADFLNERADVTVTSRATQISLDALQATLDSLQTRLNNLRDAMVGDDGAIEQGLDDILDDATRLAAQLAALADDIQNIRFRVEVTQVNIIDAQDRLADVQGQAIELAEEVTQLRTHLQTIHSGLTTAQSAQQTAAREQRDRSLAAALGDPDRVVIRYRLPVANGGELERSREILIRALISYEALGADTAAARALLLSGDNAYNQGQPLDAYDFFARAYRLLLGTQTTTPALIARDSFE